MIPLLPPSATFHSSVSSKSPNWSRVIRSPASPTRVSAPSTTCHPAGTLSFLNPRQASSDRPSKSVRHSPCMGVDALLAESRFIGIEAALDDFSDEQPASTKASSHPAASRGASGLVFRGMSVSPIGIQNRFRLTGPEKRPRSTCRKAPPRSWKKTTRWLPGAVLAGALPIVLPRARPNKRGDAVPRRGL